MKKMLAALGCTLAVLLGSVAYNPPSAAADIPVHAWNTTPQSPVNFYRLPFAVSTFTTGEYSNATLVATCVLKQQEPGVWRSDGCDDDWFDFDHTGTDWCWFNRRQNRWIGYFVTQTWVTIHHADGRHQTVALASEPVELTCYGGKSTLEGE